MDSDSRPNSSQNLPLLTAGQAGRLSRQGRLVRWCSPSLLGAAVWLASGIVWADGGDPVAARAQLRQGYALKQQGKCKEAVPFLQESARLDRQPKTLLNLGDCEVVLGQLAAAQAHFVEARDLARQQGNDSLKSIGEKRLQEIEKKMPKLSITLAKDAPSDTVVTRDGVEVGGVSLHTALPIDMGRHVVVARGGGFERQYEVTLAEGETKNLEITPIGGKALPKPVAAAAEKPSSSPASRKEAARSGSAFKIEGPSPDRTESGSSTQRTLGFITLGAGVVGIGAGAYFGARALSKNAEAEPMCTVPAPCERGGVDAADFEALKREAHDARTYSYIGVGVGGAAALTGIILLLTAPKTTTTGWRVGPTIGQTNVGAVIDGRF